MVDTVEWCTVVWQVVDQSAGSNSDLVTFGLASLSGLLGIGGIIVGQITSARAEKKSVRAALLAEVEAMHDMCVIRKYVEGLRADANYFRSPEGISKREKGEGFQISIPATDFNLIYKANLSRLGGLSRNEARLIVRFHQLVEGALQDVSEGGTLHIGSNEPDDYDEAADVLEQALSIAKVLIAEHKPWWRFQWQRGQNVDTENKGKVG